MPITGTPLINHARRALHGLTAIFLVAAVGAAAGSEIEPLERILETARTFLTDALGTDEHVETRIEIGRLDNRLRLQRCAHPPTAQLAPGARAEGSTTVNVRCSEPAPWSIFVPVRVERYAEVVVAARSISRQQIIQPDDVRLERQETSQLAAGYVDDIASVVGLQARRALTPGQVLSGNHLAPRQLITRGQQVTLFADRPGLSVRMTGEALEDGAVGQRIRVRNRSSKRIVEGYVEPSGAVRVTF